MIVNGLTVTQAAEKAGVRYEADGLEGLNDRPHRPATCPHQMLAHVEEHRGEGRRRDGAAVRPPAATPAPWEKRAAQVKRQQPACIVCGATDDRDNLVTLCRRPRHPRLQKP